MTYTDPESRPEGAGYDLADLVCHELRRAGLPAYVELPGMPKQPGVWVEVNDEGEYAGGVYVRWSAPELAETGLQAVTDRQNPAAPEWKRYTEVVVIMQTALVGILRLAGFSVVKAEEVDDVAEGDVYVHAGTPS
ncbi:hypothetical protein ACWDU8_26750 [Streptomyces sp. NPDC003388]|uniref:hypothetical protein n=1 Tax=Streptomyces sp. 1-11 TaxID=2590549 RepID=UPI00116A5BB2|nr:hypothetical protein [Streptomyces sp. 1-11]GEK00575.1 hypothetical protein TNCT1_28510 [Streptomyces sp. 1-11]